MGQTLDFEIFSHSQESVELLLSHVDFSLIHEVEDTDELLVLDPLEVEQGVLVWIAPQHISEEGGAGGEDHFVGVHLGIVTSKRHVEKVFLFPEISEGGAHV